MKSFLNTFKKGLQRTKTKLVRNIKGIFSDDRPWSESDYEELEASLIAADLGVAISTRIVSDIRDRYERGEITTAEDILRIAREDVVRILGAVPPPMRLGTDGPTVILFVGVNGSGKTTTCGKLAHQLAQDGNKVTLAACDTFRAAAIEQIKIWGDRVGAQVISGKHGADAASVAYDAVSAAKARGSSYVLIDTAGRQATRKNLMQELGKIRRVTADSLPGAPHETWLVVDGSTGTNALMQAREFSKVAPLTGLCLTKLDGSSKGGIVVAIREELGLPVRYIGLGEGIDDLQPFDPDAFAQALFED